MGEILLGFEVGTGQEVYMSLHHTVVTGMTQLSGKTTTLEAVINRSGLRAIAFKTKRGEAGFSSYREVQPFLLIHSDWRYIASLLEAHLQERMKFERSWIMKATKGTKHPREVLANVKALKAKARPGSLNESVYTVLEAYLEEVVPQIEGFNFAKELSLSPGVNVMDLSIMTLEMRSLVIRSVMEQVIDKLSDVVVVIPEAWEYIPQGRGTPVKLYAETFIRKGASIGNYLFVDSQDIAGIDKTPLRSCDNWIMGRQKEAHEVDRVREILGMKVSEEEIRGLPLGHFIAYLGNVIKKVYVLPAGVPEEMGRNVALGRMAPDDVREFMVKKGGDDELYRQKYEEAKAEVDRLRKGLEAKAEESPAYKELRADRDLLVRTLEESANEHRAQLAKVEAERDKLKKDVETLNRLEAEVGELKPAMAELRKDLENYENLKKALMDIIGPIPVSERQIDTASLPPESISATVEKPALHMTVQRKRLAVTEADLLGKVTSLWVKGELGTDWFTSGAVQNLCVKYGWRRDPRTSNVLTDLVRWGFAESRMAGRRPEYRFKMKADEAQKQGLLTVEEKQI